MNSLFVAWRPPVNDPSGWRPVGRLEHDGDLYRFWYTRGAQKPGFRPFAQMAQLDGIYESSDLFPIFANRLLSESRPEYESFMRWSGFDSETSTPDPILVLGVTEGLRQTDAIEVFPCPVPDSDSCYFNKFFLHGIRWMPNSVIESIGRLKANERLRIMLDPQNAYDSNAVAVRTEAERMMIGYVPRYLARDVWHLVQTCDINFIHLTIDRVNVDAPLQNRVLVRMRACWPDGFEPCSGEDFAPISANASTRC